MAKRVLSASDILNEVQSDVNEEITTVSEKFNIPVSVDEPKKAEDLLDFKQPSVKSTLESRDIVWLPELSKKSIPIAGGKGANLAEMYNLKLPVPAAFIVTATAYKRFIESTGLRERILSTLHGLNLEDTQVLEKKAQEVREMIMATHMPVALATEIKAAYENLDIDRDILDKASKNVLGILKTAKEPIFVAVRSSATTEDLATASFAGQQETFLNIRGANNLVESVKKCWASLFTARAVYYRQKKGFATEIAFIAVVVQKMVNADKAGVIFTINPSTNNDTEIVVEAAFGLGEGVVSGTVAPDYYVVDKETLKPLSKKISNKKTYFTRSSAGETVQKPLDHERANEQVLELRELVRLAAYARQLEEHYGKPQDIEWGIEFGRIYILQTRPVTTQNNKISEEKIGGEVILKGLPASPGVGSGVVRIVKDLSELYKVKTGDVLATKMTNPDMVVTMQKASAIVTDEGGMTAHAAIVSRELGIPCIVGTGDATSKLQEGEVITVDGRTGEVYRGNVTSGSGSASIQQTSSVEELTISEAPSEDPLLNELLGGEEKPVEAEPIHHYHEQKYEEPTQQTPHLPSAPHHQGETATRIYMNLGQPDMIDKFKSLEFDGIGLMRLEFIIASQIKKHPLYLIETGQSNFYVESLANAISKVAGAIKPKPVVVRFSDFKSNEYKGLEGGAKYEVDESNPMIGFRGVSRYISDKFEQAFRLECRAMKKAHERSGNVWAMLPFVRETNEVKKCLAIMESEGLVRGPHFKIWLMAEVPSVAILPEEFAKLEIDGASIGSNDLTQLILGVDRDSATLGKMGYFDERNKAVLTGINNIIRGFKKHGKTVSICGQAPSVYPEMVEFLVKQGIDSMSVNPDSVNSVRKHVAEVEKRILLDAVREKNSMSI